jgi:DHA3 family macrolide efflux protein-like MFS transporter
VPPAWGKDGVIESIPDTAALAEAGRPLLFGRNFALLWGGQFVSQMGDRLAVVALTWLVYKATDSAFSTGITLALYTLPYVVFGMLAGVIIDRFNKRMVMVIADVLRAALVLSVPFLATRWLPSVYLLSFATSSLSVLFDPCKLAILPDLVPAPKLLRANSLLASGESLTEVAGYATAGFVVLYVGSRGAFTVDSASFAASAAALALMRYRPVRQSAARFTTRGIVREAAEGLRCLLSHRGLSAITVLLVGAAVGLGATYPLIFLYAVRTVGGGTGSFGLMESAIAVGMLAGGAAMAWRGDRVQKGLVITLGVGVLGACIAILGAVSSLYAALVTLAVAGAANSAAVISINTYFQQTVRDDLLGRVLGVRFALTQGVYALSVLGAAALATSVDVSTLFIACGALVALPALVGVYIAAVRHA